MTAFALPGRHHASKACERPIAFGRSTLLIALKVPHVSGGEVSALNALVVIVMTSILHGNVSSNAAIKAAAGSAQPVQPRHGG